MRKVAILMALGGMALLRCASTMSPAPEKLSAPARHLVDPQTGYPGAIPPSRSKSLRQAWDAFRAARVDRASQRYSDLVRRDGSERVARLGLAAIAIEQGRFEEAAAMIDLATATIDGWSAAANYRAEVARARGDLREAWMQYEVIAGVLPIFRQRGGEIRAQYVASLLARVKHAEPQERESVLREALSVDPASSPARLQLVETLTALERWDAARSELQPLIAAGHADLNEVQAALSEIEVGRGELQSAIRRYERLVARTGDTVYARRLGEIRVLWQEANLPPHYQRAAKSHALTRAELAILAFWRVDAVRFAQGVGPPPIAVDIANVAGREEFVRCLALGIVPVDPVTREANPSRTLTVHAFLRASAKLLDLAGSPACAASRSAQDPASLLAACGIDLSMLPRSPDAFIEGRAAARVLDQIAQRGR